jgi:intein/homing endonuclease
MCSYNDIDGTYKNPIRKEGRVQVDNKRILSIEDIIKLYQNGKGTSEIANIANISLRRVNQILTKENVEKRAFGYWKRQYTVNEDYFKNWSNNMAYILGFFVADGLIDGKNQLISFSQKDREILEKIKAELGSNQPLTQNKRTGVFMLNISSKIMKMDLMEIHGIMPNKSKVVKFPHVPKEYLSHFIRGYFDGDGCIYKDRHFINIVGGSLDFMESLVEIFSNQGLGPILKSFGKHYRVYISGFHNIKNFANWIYHEKEIYLRRKFERFEKHINSNLL